ncbi:MAG TPA: HupE/UreJ family protein [Aromatoleum sp.]|uniref:HupE/UreJ family protein n=1 Tax=Aromatoleum sp. TaxID=2307007 RepID=UPI002B4A509B|nr:HupE/UreJ family protein [Aromatoleum sp.]HJV28340.1 HupE/UreJ family protein [Aromatoleum sp.]
MNFLRRLPVALALSVAAGSAMAHGGHGEHSFFAGFAHPIGGIDHLLAMLAVGLFAARQRGALRWALPATFVVAMIGGALLAASGLVLPSVETGVAASLLVFGLLIAFVAKLPAGAALPLVAAFAMFHGHAHEVESGHASMLMYAAGFVSASLTLHAAGFLLACWMPESAAGRAAQRVLGGLIAGTGLVLLGS